MDIKIIYKSDPLWMHWNSQITFDNEFVLAGILVIKNELVLGQAMVYHNPFHEIKGEQAICIGNISLPNEEYIFNSVHRMSIEIATSLGLRYIISPMNGSTWNSYRFVSYQPKEPFLLETSTKPYSFNHYKRLGYQNLASYFSQETTELTDNWEKCEARYQNFVKKGMCFDRFDLSKPKEEFKSLATFCNKAFRKNFLFSPIQEEDFVQKMMQLVPILNPAYTIISRMEDSITGFVFAYQDMYNKKEKSLVFKTLARDIDKPYGGLGTILSALTMKAGIQDGFTHCIHALMIDHNASTTISNNFLGEIRSKYELLYYTI